MTKQSPAGRYHVYSATNYHTSYPSVVPAARYDNLSDAIEHADSVTYRMAVVDSKEESRGFIHVNWEQVDAEAITIDCLNRVLPVVADSWEQLRGCDVERLLDSIAYDDQDGVADAADIIKVMRPDLAKQVDAAAEYIANGYRV